MDIENLRPPDDPHICTDEGLVCNDCWLRYLCEQNPEPEFQKHGLKKIEK
jgi:hypothetical protein